MSFLSMVQQVLSGVGSTLLIFFSTLIFSLPLGLLVAMGRMNNWAPFRCLSPEGVLGKFKPVQLVIKFLISILRGTPLMLQLTIALGTCWVYLYSFYRWKRLSGLGLFQLCGKSCIFFRRTPGCPSENGLFCRNGTGGPEVPNRV